MEYKEKYLCGIKWNGKGYNKKGDIVYIVNNDFNKKKKITKTNLYIKGKKNQLNKTK